MALPSNLGAYLPTSSTARRRGGLLGVAALALVGSAVLVNRRATRAELDYPPRGSFVTTDGVRLHYIARGAGESVVFLHGNGAMVEDILISGLFDKTAEHYRAIAIDRPGFGHSERPRDRAWTATSQAALLVRMFSLLGIERPIVVAHSWATLVALSIALDHPDAIRGLVLASGYYFPTARTDAALFSPPAVPLVGDLFSYTVAPVIGEAISPTLIKKMFAPQPVSPCFEREFPMGLALRPSQIKAFAQDSSHMIAAARQLSSRYSTLRCPTVIMAGDADRIVDVQRQAHRLHGALAGSRLDVLQGAGHMIHHLDPDRILRAVDLISTGGITLASVHAEAATWGT